MTSFVGFIQRCCFTCVIVALLGSGCISTGGILGFTRTPIDPGSRQSACGTPTSGGQYFARVLIIVFENQNRADVMDHHYFRALATEGADFTRFHGLFHLSYSNYLAMVAGKEIVTAFDTQADLKDRTVADLLEENGKSWKNYAEGYPGSRWLFHGRAPVQVRTKARALHELRE